MLIRNLPKSQAKESDITPEKIYQKRRSFLKASAGAFGAGLVGTASAKLDFNSRLRASPYSSSEELTSEKKVTSYNNFYELSSGKYAPAKLAHRLKTEPWSIEVAGHCAKPGTYDLDNFTRPHTLEDRVYRLRCVEAWSMVIPWVGFELNKIITQAEPMAKAKYVAFTSVLDPENLPGQSRRTLDWPYKEGLRMDEAMHPLTLLSVGLYGKVLPNQNGAPIRLVVPWKYGFKSIKSIKKIEFVETMPATAWGRSAPSEYGFYSNVNPQVSHPRWSQRRERRIGEFKKRKTLMFNGYDQVASLYTGMDLKKNF